MEIPANNTATSSVTLTPSADLHIAKEGPLNAVAGTNVVYTITVTNAGPSDATGVTLTDPTPPGLTFVSNAGDCTTAFPCDLGTLPRAATRTITATFAIPAGYTTPNPIANTATVTSPTPDAAAGNNSATTNTPVGPPVTDLHITKTNGVDGVVAGRPTTYTITITNPLGPSDATGATVIDTFPATLTGVTWTCAGTGGGTCVTGGSGHINTPVTVPVGASVVFTATGTVDPAATGELVNAAEVLPPTLHVNRTSAIATDRDPIATEADVAITKTGTGHDHRGQSARLHDHCHQQRAVGRRGRDGERCLADRPGVRVEHGRLHDRFPVHARGAAGRRHPDHHRDLHRSSRLQRPVADRERDHCVLDDARHEHGEQRGDHHDDVESRCGRRGHEDRAFVRRARR